MDRVEVGKRYAYAVSQFLHMGDLFRYLNRHKVLILAYHGITENEYSIKPGTHISLQSFKGQIKSVSERYAVIPLTEAVRGLTEGRPLPKNPAVITFDDGYRNNYTSAWPVLEKYRVPATIFLTAGYIGSDAILPLDEAYLTITHPVKRRAVEIPEIGLGPLSFATVKDMMQSYHATVSCLKRFPTREQKHYVGKLGEMLETDYAVRAVVEDFRLLSWGEVSELLKTGLIDFGAHTVNHEICTNVPLESADKEISESKRIIESMTGREVTVFAYPNGKESDYHEGHVASLKKHGFLCSVTTSARLNTVGADPFRLGRMCVGPDFAADPERFGLKISGFNLIFRKLVQR